MRVRVTETKALTDSVRLIQLERADGTLLPPFAAGSHIELTFRVGEKTLRRKYSLVSSSKGGLHYQIAVKKSSNGRGGSVFLHDALAIGAELEASEPIDEFSIVPGAKHHVLIAGGIGITPILSIASRLSESGSSYELHYSARRRSDMAFHDHLSNQDRDKTTFYFTESAPFRRIDVDRLLAAHVEQLDTHVYVCGPAQFIDKVRLAAGAAGIHKQRVHFEGFGPGWRATDSTVRLTLTTSRIDLAVEPGTTLLDAMEQAGVWIASDCRRGECGACITDFTSGTPLHRDHCLTEEQRMHSFCPCVSWASSEQVLTLQI